MVYAFNFSNSGVCVCCLDYTRMVFCFWHKPIKSEKKKLSMYEIKHLMLMI